MDYCRRGQEQHQRTSAVGLRLRQGRRRSYPHPRTPHWKGWPPGREPFAGFIKPRLGGHKQFYLDLLVRLRAAEHCCIMLLAAKQNAPRYSANRSGSATVCGQPEVVPEVSAALRRERRKICAGWLGHLALGSPGLRHAERAVGCRPSAVSSAGPPLLQRSRILCRWLPPRQPPTGSRQTATHRPPTAPPCGSRKQRSEERRVG